MGIYTWSTDDPGQIRDILDQLEGFPNLVWEPAEPDRQPRKGAPNPPPKMTVTYHGTNVPGHSHRGAKDPDNPSSDDVDPPKGGVIR